MERINKVNWKNSKPYNNYKKEKKSEFVACCFLCLLFTFVVVVAFISTEVIARSVLAYFGVSFTYLLGL